MRIQKTVAAFSLYFTAFYRISAVVNIAIIKFVNKNDNKSNEDCVNNDNKKDDSDNFEEDDDIIMMLIMATRIMMEINIIIIITTIISTIH